MARILTGIEKEQKAGFKDTAQREQMPGRYQERQRKLNQAPSPAAEPSAKRIRDPFRGTAGCSGGIAAA
jgi:hypothetical protein